MKKRPVLLLTLLEALLLAAGLAALCLVYCLSDGLPLWQRICLAPVVFCVMAVVCGAALICHKGRRQSVFSALTVKTLGHMSGALTVLAALFIPLGLPVMDLLLQGLPQVHVAVRAALPSFTAMSLAIMVRTVQLLMRRAVALQADNDLTV